MGSKQEKRLAKGKQIVAAQDAVRAVQHVGGPFGEGAQEDAAAQVAGGLAEVLVAATTEVVAGGEPLTPSEAGELAAQVATGVYQQEKGDEALAAGVPVLHVKQGLALRGGRGEWYKLLCKYDGQPVAAYIADGKANPASHYTARSTKCGQPKTPESRLSWFKRAGIVTIS